MKIKLTLLFIGVIFLKKGVGADEAEASKNIMKYYACEGIIAGASREFETQLNPDKMTSILYSRGEFDFDWVIVIQRVAGRLKVWAFEASSGSWYAEVTQDLAKQAKYISAVGEWEKLVQDGAGDTSIQDVDEASLVVGLSIKKGTEALNMDIMRTRGGKPNPTWTAAKKMGESLIEELKKK